MVTAFGNGDIPKNFPTTVEALVIVTTASATVTMVATTVAMCFEVIAVAFATT